MGKGRGMGKEFMLNWIVEDTSNGVTLQQFISNKTAGKYSNKAIKKFIDNKCCRLNGRIELFANTPLVIGDEVSLKIPDLVQEHPIKILFEDDHYLALDKWAGLVCKGPILGYKLGHRLDKDTTGVLLLAKTDQALKRLIDCFRNKVIWKTYLAICSGVPQSKSGVLKSFLRPAGKIEGQTYHTSAETPPGEYAETGWEVVESTSSHSLIEALPITGRTHQLRIHLHQIGCPILGDPLYNKNKSSLIIPRHMLHASQILFRHPFTELDIMIKSPIPEDFIKVWNTLGGKIYAHPHR